MKKSLFLSVCLASLMFSIDFNSVINGIDNFTQKAWDNLNAYTGNIANKCYEPQSIDIDGNLNVCGILDKVDLSRKDICNYLPNMPGLKKKNSGINGQTISKGIKNFCSQEDKEFSDIVSKGTQNIQENIFKDGVFKEQNLPNGEKNSDFMAKIDIKSLLQFNKNLLMDYIMKNKTDEINTIIDFLKSASAKNIKLDNLKIKDIKAPEKIQDYRQGFFQLGEIYSETIKQNSPSNISNNLAIKLKNSSESEALSVSTNYLNTIKKEIEIAKANEIGHQLELLKENDDIAIPTQEYVDILREDVKIEAIAQIRKQQIRNAEIVNKVNQKWDKIEILTELLAQKEIIMRQQFDEVSARQKIEKIVASAN